MRLNHIYIFILFLIFPSCQQELNKEEANNIFASKKYSVTFTEGIKLKTDSSFNYNAVSNYYLDQKNGKDKMVVKNQNKIYEFDISNGNIVSKIEYPVQGPNSVKGTHKVDGIIKIDENNYLITYHMLAEIYRVDSLGAHIQFQLDPHDREIKAFYASSSVFPIKNAKNEFEIIFPLVNHSRVEKHTHAFAFGKFNIKTGQYQESVHYPKVYDKHSWGDQPYAYLTNLQFIPEKQQYFVSFPIEHRIYVYDSKFNFVKTNYVQSKFISNIAPFKQKKLTMSDEIDYLEDRKYFRAMSFYMGAYYDPSTQLYYRLVRRAIENESGDHDYQYSFIICNLDLEIIDEVTVDSDQYNIFRTFVCSKGLMLLNESKMVDESEIPYDRMKVEYPL